jgi:glutamyl-tRNA synthetase
MLAFLGWNPGTEQEVFSMEELIKAFSFERVHKAGARFDPEKAKWFNEQYLRQQSDESLAAHFVDQLKEKLGADDARANMQFATAAVRLVKDRIHFEHEMIGMSTCLFEAPTTYDEKVVAKRWNDKAKTFFAALPAQLNTVSDFTAENTKLAFEQLAAQQELKPGDVLQMFRVLVSGQGSGLDLFGMVALLGKEEVNKRIEAGRVALN